MVHRHGCYFRYEGPEGDAQEAIQLYLCYPCGLTISVLPSHRLPYRSVKAERLQADFDQRSELSEQGPDPPPRSLEAGCLKRAWSSLSARVHILTEAFGQLLGSGIEDAVSLWRALRQTKNSVANLLRFLSEHHHISLLGNYRCLQAPS
jgi:hypothetical protein